MIRQLLRMHLYPKSQHPWAGQEWAGGPLHRPHGERSKGLRKEEEGRSSEARKSSGLLTAPPPRVCMCPSVCLSQPVLFHRFLSRSESPFPPSSPHLSESLFLSVYICSHPTHPTPPPPAQDCVTLSSGVSVPVSEALPSSCSTPGSPFLILLHSRAPPAAAAVSSKRPMTIPTTGIEDLAGDSAARE